MKLPTWVTTVTPFSKALALFFFITFPIAGFFFGMKYYEHASSLKAQLCNTANTSSSTNVTCNETSNSSISSSLQNHYGYSQGQDDTVWFIDETVVETNPEGTTSAERADVIKYLKLSFPKAHPLVDRVESPSFDQPFTIYTKTPGCVIDTSGAIGRGGGDSREIFDTKLGDFTYRFDAWSWDSTFSAHNEDWSIQFGLNSIGSSDPNFELCINDMKQILPSLKAEYVP